MLDDRNLHIQMLGESEIWYIAWLNVIENA